MRVPRSGAPREPTIAIVVGLLGLLLFGFALPLSLRLDTEGRRTESASAALPELELDIPIRGLMLLGTLRDRSLETGFLFRSSGDMVRASMTAENHRERVQIRLKGDWIDHLRGNKWSWRVHVLGGGEILGLRRFSLQAPTTRDLHFEALFFEHLRMEGVLAPRYEFVHLTISDFVDAGVMALEEHFSKELLEAQRRREGVIIRFDEADYWLDRQRREEAGIPNVAATDFNWRLAKARPFRASVIEASEPLTAQARLAAGMLRAIQQKAAPPSELLDVDLLGRFLAVAEYWGYWHGLRWHNIRFYLNPYTLKLEPVAFDASSFGMTRGLFVDADIFFLAKQLLADPVIHHAYREHLARLLDEAATNSLLARLEPLERSMVASLKDEFPDVKPLMAERIRSRVRWLVAQEIPTPEEIAARITKRRPPDPKASHLPYVGVTIAHIVPGPDGSTLELATSLAEDVTVTNLTIGDGPGATPLTEHASVDLPLTLSATGFESRPAFTRIPLPDGIASDASIHGTSVVASQPGRVYPFQGHPYQPVVAAPYLAERASLDSLLAQHAFLRWDGQAFSIEPGAWSVRAPLVIPRELIIAGLSSPVVRPAIRIPPGVTLQFARDAYLLSFGPVVARGTAQSPIVISGLDGERFRGLAVLEAGEESILEHVHVSDAEATQHGPWSLTAAVTFYDSRVVLRQTTIRDTNAEDALNIVRSEFSMDQVEISGTSSDAFDSDFSDGEITRSRFHQIGGDAIDTSGSRITVAQVEISEVGDKAISAGERSALVAREIKVNGAGAGIVSKDLSDVSVDGIALHDIHHAAFMSYIKKPEFGPAKLVASNADVERDAVVGIVQLASSLRVNGAPIEPEHVDVESLYSEGFMRK